MDRILQGTGATIEVALTVDGTASNPTPDSATVTVTNAAGTVLVADTAATDTGTGEFSYNLTPTETVDLDLLTAVWTYERDGNTETATTRHEIVGGFTFTTGELNARLTDTTSTYTNAQLADARTYAEQFIEDRINIALVPRFDTHRGTASGTGFRIPRHGLRAIRWANTYSLGVATALTASELLALEADAGVVYGSWPSGLRAVEIGYEHGEDSPSPEAKEAALAVAAQRLVQGPVDDRATQRASEFGPVNLATPGLFGSYTGIPFVDEFINAHRIPAVA
jgi:hypothetical protein